jgi:hypothetical protein
MVIKVRVEGDLEEMKEAFGHGLFDWESLKKKEPEEKKGEDLEHTIKRSIEWRSRGPFCKEYHNTQVITDVEVIDGTLVFTYYMADDGKQKPWTFEVPEDNHPFIQDAIDSGILETDKELIVTIESNKKKSDRWIRCLVDCLSTQARSR